MKMILKSVVSAIIGAGLGYGYHLLMVKMKSA